MKLSSQFISKPGTYHQETKLTYYCRWLGQKQLHISLGATLTSCRSQQHGGPTRLICDRHSLKKNLDLVGRNDRHLRGQHGLSSSGLALHPEWSFVNSAATLSHCTYHTALTMAEACSEPCFSGRFFPLEQGERPVFGFTALHRSLQLRRGA